ncbi:MAG: phage tail protein [Candidatus Protistobacter heckmanni]|nr:phage tail protein [Candidatus Protistobacter heckmanni]
MAVFTWTPSVGASVAMKPAVRRVTFGDGYEQRLAFGLNTQAEVWNLEFRGRTTADASDIDAFLRARGAVDAFDWTTPTGTAGKFTCEEWSRSVDEPNVETVRATFKQVFDL